MGYFWVKYKTEPTVLFTITYISYNKQLTERHLNHQIVDQAAPIRTICFRKTAFFFLKTEK